MDKIFHIAVDGPVAAGKGTVCRLVATKLGILYVDTGAMYRVAALVAKNHGLDFDQEEKILPFLEKAKIDLQTPNKNEKDGRLITVLLDGEDVSWKIRTEEFSFGSSTISKLKKVRQVLVKKQQEIAERKSVVMEGRDITYRVLPNADLKIYLTGSNLVRAKRRHTQLLIKGQDISFDKVHQDMMDRDKQDSERGIDPLKIVDDAWVIDTSDLSIEEVVDIIIDRVKAIKAD